MTALPNFPANTRFFQDKDHWRATRPAGAYTGKDCSWFIYPNGLVRAGTMTYEGFCAENLREMTRDAALEAFREAFSQQLPEGF